MQLSKRLSAIGDLVTPGNRVADVGCDHGYLPVALVLNKKIPSAIAMDVKEGPLARAMEHISDYGLEDYIETRISDGLAALKPQEAQTLVIAGMGGPLMERILTQGAQVRDSFQELILQPQSDIGHFRHYLGQNGYTITQERIILEEGKFYPMMRAVQGEMPPYREMDYRFGKLLLQKKDPVLRKFLEREERLCAHILEQLSKNLQSSAAGARMEKMKEEEALIKAALKIYEM